MDFFKILPLLITFIITIFGSYITIRVTIAELKKDHIYLKEKLESELASKIQHEAQAKDDMKEVKDDLKLIFKSINEIQKAHALSIDEPFVSFVTGTIALLTIHQHVFESTPGSNTEGNTTTTKSRDIRHFLE